MLNSRGILTIIVLLATFFRLFGLNWDGGHYLHPDERLYVNASGISLPQNLSEFFSPDSPANPKMFYYGSFPLYFYKIIQALFFPTSSFLITSRLVSSLLSITTIPLIFLIGQELFSKKIGLLAAFIFAFSPGSIQHAHFNTTESWLVFLLTSITLLSIKAVKEKNYRLFIPLGILMGLSYATKIVGLTFILLPALSLGTFFLKEKNRQKTILWGLLFIILFALSGFLAAPYQIIDFTHFSREQEFMQGVTYGEYKPPFIIIYEGTLPYLYPLIKILPFTFGFVALSLALLGLVQVSRRAMPRVLQKGVLIASFIKQFKLLKCFGSWRSRSEPRLKRSSQPPKQGERPLFAGTEAVQQTASLFAFLYPLLYFLWIGAWYAKFSRYYLLLFPFLSLWTALALEKLKKPLLIFSLLLIALNGLLFLRVYLQPHTRIQASKWLYQNVPQGSIIAGEHWDDNLPLPLPNTGTTYVNNYPILQLPVYDEPDNETKITRLAQLLSQSDYLVLSSRRVYYSILRNREKYPLTSHFYQLLFSEKLGFKLAAKFTNYPYFLSDDLADETFQSYDHPPVLIFKNGEKLSAEQLKSFILDYRSDVKYKGFLGKLAL